MRKLFEKADIVVGHNIIRWDIPNLERILKIKIKCKFVDTLALSWTLFPNRIRHGLDNWGETFGIPKPKISSWFELPLEDYIHRCEEDVKINTRLWKLIWNKLLGLYGSEKEVWRYIDYISFKMKCARLQEESGWKVDTEFCSKELANLLKEQQERLNALIKVMPRIPIKTKKAAPKRLYNKHGGLTVTGTSWFNLLASRNLPDDTQEIEIITGYEEGNPRSSPQVKDWLFSLGWVPLEYKHTKSKATGLQKKVPQINLPHGKGICPNIKRLFEREPSLEHLDGLSIINHRIPILKGFLDTRDANHRVQARMNGLTNTLRYQHSNPCVNLPKPEKPYSQGVRGSLISDTGYVLCGADMSSLEDRLKQHFIYPIDPDYVRTMLRDDFDPHLELAMIADKVTQEDKALYQRVDDPKYEATAEEKKEYKRIKNLRAIFKNGNYACQYGAFPKRLAITCGVPYDEAKEVFDAYWELNKSIKTVTKQQDIRRIGEEMWLRNPINGFYYSLRSEKDIFSTLVQGSASYVFDLWVEYVLEEREQLTAQFHDEIVIEILKGAEDKAKDLLNGCIDKVNNKLKLNRELAIGIQFGSRYSEIH